MQCRLRGMQIAGLQTQTLATMVRSVVQAPAYSLSTTWSGLAAHWYVPTWPLLLSPLPLSCTFCLLDCCAHACVCVVCGQAACANALEQRGAVAVSAFCVHAGENRALLDNTCTIHPHTHTQQTMHSTRLRVWCGHTLTQTLSTQCTQHSLQL